MMKVILNEIKFFRIYLITFLIITALVTSFFAYITDKKNEQQFQQIIELQQDLEKSKKIYQSVQKENYTIYDNFDKYCDKRNKNTR